MNENESRMETSNELKTRAKYNKQPFDTRSMGSKISVVYTVQYIKRS